MNYWTKLLIGAVIVAVPLGILWYQGQLQRLSVYVAETREELRKCSWPSWDELKGSTLLIAICVGLLGLFTYLTDILLSRGVHFLFH